MLFLRLFSFLSSKPLILMCMAWSQIRQAQRRRALYLILSIVGVVIYGLLELRPPYLSMLSITASLPSCVDPLARHLSSFHQPCHRSPN